MAPNLHNCFNEKLPDVAVKHQVSTQTKTSSLAVEIEELPRLVLKNDGLTYITSAVSFLSTNVTALTEQPDVTPEPNPELRNEADVVAHARTNLLNPIMRAVDIEHCGLLSIATELGVETLRVDVAVMSRANEQVIMMVEFKRWGYIQAKVFRTAIKNSTFKESTSATRQVKQALAYARRSGCLYTALCDYNNLVLLKFSQDLSTVEVTIVPTQDFRKALLGFLLIATRDSDRVLSSLRE